MQFFFVCLFKPCAFVASDLCSHFSRSVDRSLIAVRPLFQNYKAGVSVVFGVDFRLVPHSPRVLVLESYSGVTA